MRTSGAEFEQALDRAELLLRGVREMRRSLRRVAVAQISCAGSAAFVAGIVLILGRPAGAATVATVLLTAAVTTLVTLTTRILLVEPLRPQIRRDERTMIELVDMLRELTPHLSRHEQWSDVRRLLVRTRLERFPVGAEDPQ